MTVSRWVRTIAGLFILLSLAFGTEASPLYLSSHWLWFTAFVGLNLFQSGLSNWCLMDRILTRAGVPVQPRCCARAKASSQAQGHLAQ